MNKDELQNYIYIETLLAQLYRQIAAVAPRSDERNAFLSFSQDASRNAEKLNQIYRDQFGTNFNPIVPETVLQGGYRELLNEILDLELASTNALRSHTYFQNDLALNKTLRQIADDKLSNVIQLLAIFTNYNSTQIDQLKKEM